jgi:hypothetical protein
MAKIDKELTRMERAKFVHEVQKYLKGAAPTLHKKGVDIHQMQYDGRSLFIGIDRNHPPNQRMAIEQDTVRNILKSHWPDLEVGFNPVDMTEAPKA